jgi:hypothetical protein
MKRFHAVLPLAILSASLSGGIAVAQDHHDNHQYVEHKEWRKGAALKDSNREAAAAYRKILVQRCS